MGEGTVRDTESMLHGESYGVGMRKAKIRRETGNVCSFR